jgi:hypothetical protein
MGGRPFPPVPPFRRWGGQAGAGRRRTWPRRSCNIGRQICRPGRAPPSDYRRGRPLRDAVGAGSPAPTSVRSATSAAVSSRHDAGRRLSDLTAGQADRRVPTHAPTDGPRSGFRRLHYRAPFRAQPHPDRLTPPRLDPSPRSRPRHLRRGLAARHVPGRRPPQLFERRQHQPPPPARRKLTTRICGRHARENAPLWTTRETPRFRNTANSGKSYFPHILLRRGHSRAQLRSDRRRRDGQGEGERLGTAAHSWGNGLNHPQSLLTRAKLSTDLESGFAQRAIRANLRSVAPRRLPVPSAPRARQGTTGNDRERQGTTRTPSGWHPGIG